MFHMLIFLYCQNQLLIRVWLSELKFNIYIKMYASPKELNGLRNINPCDINQSHVALTPFLIMAMVIVVTKIKLSSTLSMKYCWKHIILTITKWKKSHQCIIALHFTLYYNMFCIMHTYSQNTIEDINYSTVNK
jgi:hypothetical protein